jgi:hypothetical protein
MIAEQATAKVFIQAFKALTERERTAFLEALLREKEYREDLMDIALIEERRRESSRSFRKYLSRKAKKERV